MIKKNSKQMEEVSSYYPLIVIISVIFLSSWALDIANGAFMQSFMGLFFVTFSMFKLINLEEFSKGFIKYDLVSQRYPAYAKYYPFIELALGLAYLSNFAPVLTNLVTLTVMSVSAVGVIKSIRKGMKINCACLGSILNVPLSTVSVIENVAMGIMAFLMLFVILF